MNDSQLLIGKNAIKEALLANIPIQKIVISQNISKDQLIEFKKIAQQNDIPVSIVKAEVLIKLTHTTHQGIVAYSSSVKYHTLQEILTQLQIENKKPFLLILDGITDVKNIGNIARTAWCLGVQAIITSAEQSLPIQEDSIKTSAGALLHIPIVREKSMSTVITQLQEADIKVYATIMKGHIDIDQIEDNDTGMAIIMGAEDKGIRPHVLRAVDASIRIPMKGNFDSLNVSVATGIVLYECMKKMK